MTSGYGDGAGGVGGRGERCRGLLLEGVFTVKFSSFYKRLCMSLLTAMLFSHP